MKGSWEPLQVSEKAREMLQAEEKQSFLLCVKKSSPLPHKRPLPQLSCKCALIAIREGLIAIREEAGLVLTNFSFIIPLGYFF